MAKRPNVLWVFADQLRAHALESYGNTNVQTPNLNRLAREGLRCTRAYSNYPLCCPFRASLLTGRQPWHTGVIGHAYRMRNDVRTIADSFHDAGYQTAYVGKWHLDGQPAGNRAVMGRRGGFRRFKGFELSNDFFHTKVFDESGNEMNIPPGYQTDQLTDLTLNEIEEMRGNHAPFFMVLSVEPPHRPCVAPDKYMEKFADKNIKLRPNVPEQANDYSLQSLRGYYAQIENIDTNIGRLLDYLEKNRLLDNTIVMFFSDHGDMVGSHGLRYKNWPYEESANIPLIIRYPDKIKAGEISDILQTNLDLYPTTLALAGIDEKLDVAGMDLSRRFMDPSLGDPRKGIVLTDIIPTWVLTGIHINHPWRAYVTKDYKITYKQCEFWELFDLKNDPFEMTNLIDDPAYANVKHELTLQFIDELCRSGDGFQAPKEYMKYILV